MSPAFSPHSAGLGFFFPSCMPALLAAFPSKWWEIVLEIKIMTKERERERECVCGGEGRRERHGARGCPNFSILEKQSEC